MMTTDLVRQPLVRRFAKAVLPERLFIASKRAFFAHQVKLVRAGCDRQADLAGRLDVLLSSVYFRPEQKKAEILSLLTLLQARRPKRLCEIGGRYGGTLALFAQVAAPDARILSIDLDYAPGQMDALAGFACQQQEVRCVAADSHAPETVRLLERWLEGEQLDFLLIDGDHSLAGVSQDFDWYGKYVKRGGIIAVHDIIPDSATRFGVTTDTYVGEVPAFWESLKRRGLQTMEFVENPDQDGYGIGIVDLNRSSI